VFEASREGETALWARRERGRWPRSGWQLSEPSRLTSGPMSYLWPSLSPDGRTIVAVGQPPTAGGELVRYEAASAAFKPFLGGLSAWDLEFSRDCRWIAYVQYPEGTLWRSHPDGTERRQLSFPPATAMLPRWSPDGRSIAYMSLSPGGTWNSFIVAAEGGKARPVTDQANVMDASWSPDGARVVVFESGALTLQKPVRLQVVDLQTGKMSVLPGSEGLFSPRWSPDGRSIVALSGDASRLALYQFASGRWRDLIAGAGEFVSYPTWLRDSSRIQLLKTGAIVRVSTADGRLETVASPDVAGMAQFVSRSPVQPGWVGAAPDDSPLLLRRKSGATEIYALEVEWP
jgi:Tol biopolymer transport system component